MIKIEFTRSTIKRLEQRLKMPLKIGNPGLIQRVSALLMLARGESVEFVAAVWCKTERTLYNWVNDFLHRSFDSLHVMKRTGRKANLTKQQKEKLMTIIDDGPQTWSELLQRAKSQEAALLFVDEVSFPQWGSLGYTWAKKGQQPV